MKKTTHDSETPAQNQQVITACALIHHAFDGVTKIFMPKRAETKKFLPGVYELPGGHIDFGENITDGLKRELHEELGIEVRVGDPFAAFDYTNEIKGSHSAEIIYFARLISSAELITLDPSDHSEYVWIAEDEIDRVVSPDKGHDDIEIQNVRKAFKLLRGEPLDLGA